MKIFTLYILSFFITMSLQSQTVKLSVDNTVRCALMRVILKNESVGIGYTTVSIYSNYIVTFH
jgi:hypothetical protein